MIVVMNRVPAVHEASVIDSTNLLRIRTSQLGRVATDVAREDEVRS